MMLTGFLTTAVLKSEVMGVLAKSRLIGGGY